MNSPMKFEIFLPYRLDFFAEVKLTSIFPRKFMHVLKDYKKSKELGKPILSMPNCSSGALKIGTVIVSNGHELKRLMAVLDNLSKRVFRTGLNERTACGNFRLPLNGLGIDTKSSLIFAKVDLDYPTDSYERFVLFVKTLFHRFIHEKLSFETWIDHKLDQFVLGKVESLVDINLKAFDKEFSTKFLIGFVTFPKILVSPVDNRKERMKSIFYFDYLSHEPIIGVENLLEEELKAMERSKNADEVLDEDDDLEDEVEKEQNSSLVSTKPNKEKSKDAKKGASSLTKEQKRTKKK